MKAPWCVYSVPRHSVYCTRCTGSEPVSFPLEAREFAARLEAFCELHKDCKERQP
jgi:hypothetical protein